MYQVDHTRAIVQDHEQVVGPDGTTYPGTWDKSTLAFLRKIIETPPPTDPALAVTGWDVSTDGSYSQLWETRVKTTDELSADVAAAKVNQGAVLQAAYIAACALPVSYATAGGITKTFQADPGSAQILQQTLAGLAGTQATPAGFYWLAADNTQVPVTYADLQGLAAAMLGQGWAAFRQLQARKTALAAATTVAAAQAVVW